MSDPASKQSTYLPTLDGWRALSIALVILHHSQIQLNVSVLGSLLQAISRAGEVGVELFFGISGLLICSRLLEEETRFGQINVKSFYVRRCFRILPAALFYLLVLAILTAFHIVPLLPMDWFGALFFFRNYVMVFEYMHQSPLALHWFTGHFWSLSMEEHFYLVLPGVLVVFKKTRRWILLGFIIAVALWRFVVAHVFANNYQINFRTDTHVDALFIPAVIALLLYPLLRNPAARRWIPAWSFSIFLALEIALLFTTPPFFSTLQATVIPLLILSTVLHPGSLPGRVLEMRPLRWIGWISYSLYLWQQLFFGDNFVSSPPRLAALREWPLNFFALLVCAVFSYHMVEKPFIRLGHKLSLAIANSHATKRPAQPLHQPTPEAATSSRVFVRSNSGQWP
jgi:peptidoglycan/LPS O-acetylase OafA/YrhL